MPANTTQNNDYTWPYNISIGCVRFRSNSTHKGDFVTSLIAPNTTLGALTADAAVGATTFQVSASVLQNIKIGMQVTITDGQGNSNVVDRVYQINPATNSISCLTGLTTAFKAGSLVQIGYLNIAIEIGEPGKYTFGTHQLKAAFIPAGTVVRVQYTNKDSVQAKYFLFEVETTY